MGLLGLYSGAVWAQQIQVLQTYYVPITEEQCYSAMRAISVGSPVELPSTNVMFSAWGIVASESNTVVVYDHWEDGYEADISNPTQATTQIWGDGNSTNGIPPGYASDFLNAGGYISLTNTMSVPRDVSELRYDGRDKILATKPIATARAQYAVDPGQVLAGAVQAPDVTRYGTEFVAPVGTNVAANEAFQYAAMTVIAARDNTLVDFDVNADGTNDLQVWLDEGEVYMVSNVAAGARITSSKPIQAHMLTGNIGSYYQMRWYMLFPSYQWDTEYYGSAGSRTNADAGVTYVDVHFYNPNSSSITVYCQTLTGLASVVIGPRGNGVYRMPFESGARFYTTNNMKFLGLAVGDSVDQSREWGFSLIPSKMLTTAAICGWGQGSGDLSQNANPLWISATTTTTVYVDWDSNPNTGTITDPYGRLCNAVTTIAAYAMATIYDDSGDNDQGGLRVYSYSNKIATVWGEDPRTAQTGNPYLDMGCEILALPSVTAEKRHMLIVDNNGNGAADPGDTIEYTIYILNIGWVAANNVVVMDAIPPNCTYVTNSTATNGVPISDNAAPATPFPLDEGGLFWGTLAVGATGSVSYSVTINSPYPTTGDVAVANSAFISSSIGGGGTQDPEPVNRGGWMMDKSSDVGTNRVVAGSNITYTIIVKTTGSLAQTNVRIVDVLPPGLAYVTNSTRVIYSVYVTNTVRDEFNSIAYNNQNGTTNWITDWQETGEADGPSAGSIRVLTVWSAYQLRILRLVRYASRFANLGGYTNAVLSFDYRRILMDPPDTVAIYASSNGGASWVQIGTITGPASGASDTTTLSTNYNISAFIATNTGIRFGIPVAMGANEGIAFDNVQIQFSGLLVLTNMGSAPPVLAEGYTMGTSETITVTFTATVLDPITATQFANIAYAYSAQNPGGLPAGVTNYPAWADLAVLKSVSNPTPNTNDLITYTVVVTNLGLDTATNIVVSDLLPAGIDYISSALSQGSYNGGSGIWTVGTVNASAAATLWITGRVAGGTGGWTITNTARITQSSLPDPSSSNNTSSVPVTVQLADLSVQKSVDSPAAATNQVVTFTIVVSNAGPNAATGVALYDLLPSGFTFESASPSSGTYNNVSGVWTVGTIQAGATVTMELEARVNAGTENTVLTNTARVLSLNQQEVTLLNNTGRVYVAVSGLDIGVFKTASTYEPNTNDIVAFTIVVSNFGPSDATGLVVTDSVPSGLTYLSYGASQGTYSSGTGEWQIGALDANKAVTLVITAQVNSGTGGYVITNIAGVQKVDQADYNPANDVSSAVIRVQSADLNLGKAASQTLANPSDAVSFIVWLTNQGPSTATGIVVTDAVPSGASYLSYSASHGTYDPTTTVWSIPSLASGAVASLTMNVQIAVPAGSAVTNRVGLVGSQQYDPNNVNHTSAATVTVIDARLAISKISSSTNGEPVLYFGDAVEYTVAVTNEGNVSQTGLTVRDPMPTGVTYVASSTWVTAPRHTTNTVYDRFTYASYSDNYGTTNWIVNWDEAGTDDENPESGNVRIIYGNLRIENVNRIARRMANLGGATNAYLSFLWRRDGLDDVNDYVAVQVSSNGYGGTWVEVGRVAGPGTEAFFSSTNIDISAFISTNTAVRFVSSATLGVGDYVYLDDAKITWYGRYVVTWPGSAPEALAENMELWPGETMTVRYQVIVDDPTTVTQILNVASVTSAQHQAVLQASTTNDVAKADLIVDKTVNNETPTVGATIDYTIVVSNAGPHKAKRVALTDYLPPSCVTYSNATVSQGSFDPTTMVWSVGTLDVGSNATLTLRAVVEFNDACAGLSLTNTASVSDRQQIEVAVSNDVDAAVIKPKPTQVVISRFDGRVEEGRVVLEWETASEVGTVGFYVYRSEDGRTYKKVRDDLLPAVLTSPAGGRYRLVDRGAQLGRAYWYAVEEVEAWGNRNWYGPYEVMALGTSRGVKSVAGGGLKVEEDYEREARGISPEKQARLQAVTARRSVRQAPSLANEVKVIVKSSGVYAVEASALAPLLGLSLEQVKELIRTYELRLVYRGELVRYVATASGNRMYFYGESVDSVYTDENVYWIRAGKSEPPEILWGKRPTAAPWNRAYRENRTVESDDVAVPALFYQDDADYWLWTYLIAGHPTFGAKTVDVASEARADSGTAEVTVELQGGSRSGVANEHHAVVYVNGTLVGEARWTGLERNVVQIPFSASILSNGNTQVRVEARLDSGVPYSVFYLDRVSLAFDRYYRAAEDRAVVLGRQAPIVTIRDFTNAVIHVLDVTDPKRIRLVRGTRVDQQASGRYMVSFIGGGLNYTPRYAGFTWHGAKPVDRLEAARVSMLASETNRADYIILTVPALRAAAQRLADYRAEQGYEVRVVELQDVYDTFSYGLAVPDGIREFMRTAYFFWEKAPSYLVLVGEGTFDHRNRMAIGDNLIGPKMVGTPHGMYESDAWFGDVVGDDGVPEIVVGRLPVLNATELDALIDKIIAYESGSGGDWSSRVVLVADDPDDGGDFPMDSDDIAALVPESYTREKVYLSALPINQARTRLRSAITNGAVWVNYIGHGGLDRLAQEGVLLSSDVAALVNGRRNPVLTALTCVVGRFGVPGSDSLGELLVLKQNGGMVAVWSPSGLSMNQQARRLGEGFAWACFQDGVPTVGEMILQSMEDYREAGEPLYMLRIYNLLGDPALLLK